MKKEIINNSIADAEKELTDENIDDQKRFILSQKVDVLKSINVN